MNLTRQEWIEQAAIFYYQIFSANYDSRFLINMLKGGGGNSILCGSWMKISNNFIKYRISGEALKKLEDILFPYEVKQDKIYILWKDIKNNSKLFYNNAKSIEKRIESGKLFHFDHHPSNKHIIHFLNNKVNNLKHRKMKYSEQINILAKYIDTIQTVDLITIQQDDIRTSADLQDVLTREQRDELIEDNWFELVLI